MNPHGTDTAGKPSQLKIIVWLQYTGAKLPPGNFGPSTDHARSHSSTFAAIRCAVTDMITS